MLKKFPIFFISLVFGVWLNLAAAADVTQDVYKAKIKGIYQIRVIDLITGNKAVIGSGFQFTADGYVATNYHVVSNAIHQPTQYRVEYINSDNKIFGLKVVDFDIIHDVTILKTENPSAVFLPLGESASLTNGTKIFSIGNPMDLGMTIVDGIYNGLMEKSFYKKILFSGSLNGGMSGGPAVNSMGEVLGINVATRGNAISFLVPVEFLQSLYAKVIAQNLSGVSLTDRIEKQLKENQDALLDKIIDSDWKEGSLGNAVVPAELSPAFKCWGSSKPGPDKMFDTSMLACSTEDEIFVNSSLYTGKISYQYLWLSSDKLDPYRFYSMYERIFSRMAPFENAAENDVENFICNTDFVMIRGKDVKSVLCAREYKDYP
ncbi:MAG: trypsin-like peptidase domain-containing protein, partial [Candidatus Omnitrophica bacterium]|nr:trypsin-like peptidase domain-containing protein [Candidatus Omnitrophota bacterium]